VDIVNHGFPPKKLVYRGCQIFLVSFNYLLSDFDKVTVAKIYKIISFLFHFFLLYMVMYLGKNFFKLSERGVIYLIIAVILFGAINYPIFQISKSSYLSFIKPTLGNYHNVTQFFSIVIGIGGIILLLFSIEKGFKTFFLGSVLISGSFFFKPSLFVIVAPAIFLLFLLDQDKFSLDKILGYLILLCVPLF